MPFSPPRFRAHGTGLPSVFQDAGHGEASPLLTQRSSGAQERSSGSQHRGSPRGATSRNNSSDISDASATTAASSSLSVNNSSGGVPSFGEGSSSSGNGGDCSRARSAASDENGHNTTGRGKGSIFGTPPTSISAFIAIFAHSVALQSWTSYVLAVGFHAFHVLLILSFLLSPVLFRSTIFSSQTMGKALLEAQGVLQHKGHGDKNRGDGDKMTAHRNGNNKSSSVLSLPSSVSHAPVSIESVWSIHDAVFFLEPGHVVMPTTIENSFGSLRRRKNHKKGNSKDKKNAKGGSRDDGDGKTNAGATGNTKSSNSMDNNNNDDDDAKKGNDEYDTHAYIVPHDNGGGGGDGGTPVELRAVKPRLSKPAVNGVKAAQVGEDRAGGEGPFYNFAAPPPVAPKLPLSQRKSATHGRATLSKILSAWEASPLYSSPLALTFYYYLYCIGCIILLLTATDGMLTGHFSVLRLAVSLAELLWYVHHGAHAFVIYCWMCLLSHWPYYAPYSASDAAFLRHGTPYAVVSKQNGEVAMYWFYRASPGGGNGHVGKMEDRILVSEMNVQHYLYDQAWYLQPVASTIAGAFLVLLSLCVARDLHRMLDAVVGVRVLMEPEGCVRCPLCGELMELCQQHRDHRGKSIYQSAREGTSLSVRRTMWWWRWLRSAVRGSSSGHRVHTPRLHSPLWRWLLPSWCGGGPQRVGGGVIIADLNGNISSSTALSTSDDTPYAVTDTLEDIEFYEQSAVRQSAVAPQDTVTEETAHLMRWLTAAPRADTSVAVPVKSERSSSDGSEAADALGIGSSGSSSEDEVEEGLVKAVPAAAATGSTRRRPRTKATAGPRDTTHSSTPLRSQKSLMRPRHGGSGSRHRHRSHTRSTGSTASSSGSPQQTRPRRVSRFTEEVLYWNYATRHVHHRCPKLYLDAPEATDDEDDDTDSEDTNSTGGTSEGGSCSSASASSAAGSSVVASTSTGTAGATREEKRGAGTSAAASTRAHIGDAPATASRANFSDRGLRRSLSPRATANREQPNAPSQQAARSGSQGGEGRQLVRRDVAQQPQQPQPALQRTTSAPLGGSAKGGGGSGDGTMHKAGASNTNNRKNPNVPRNYGTIGPNFSESPSQLYSRGPQPEAPANHIVQRGVYDPTKDEEDEFRPGNAFQSFDRAGWLSRLTYSWLNPLLTFGLLEPTLLRQERFLPALPEQLLSLDNIAVPAWRLWVHRKAWYANYVAKPGELLIPSNEAMERAEEQVMSFADLRDAEISGGDGDDTESSEGKQTVVMLGHTSLKQAAKFRPQRAKRSWEERLLWSVTAPIRFLLVFLFYYTYIGTSRTVRRTRRRLVRELLKDRLVAAAEDMYDENGYRAMEANEALEEATLALAEMASSCGSSAAAPSAGSALPTHMRRQLALSDVSLYYLFLEHRCGRRFLLIAAPLLLLSELLMLSVVPVLAVFVLFLQKVDTIELLPGRRETPSDQENVSAALALAALLGMLVLLQGVAQGAYRSQVQQAAMEARTCVRAMVLEKTLALPLAQRVFSEGEVVALATEEATRVATCLVSLHHTWSCPLRVVLLSLLLGYYLGWAAAAVACVGPLLTVPWLRHASHETRQHRHTAQEVTKLRLSLLQLTLAHIREVKGMLLEGRLIRRLRKARQAEASIAEEVAMAEGTAGMLSGGVTALLMVIALGAECVFSPKALRDIDVLIPTLVIFMLMTAPLLELPSLFTVVARGFLSMKRIEAYLRQTPDEFVGTWVDLTTFSAMQQQLRQDNSSSALLHYRRGSVVCRDSSFTWQHDLTEASPMTLLHNVDVCVEPGQLVVVQGSIGCGKSTLLLSILGEVNRCVTASGSVDDRGRGSGSVTDYESESSFSVVSASEAAARGVFVASPTESSDARRRRRASDNSANANTSACNKVGATPPAEAAVTLTATTAATAAATARNASQKSRDESKNRTASTTSRSAGTKSSASDRDAADSTAALTEASKLAPAGLEDGESSTGGFLVFGSCAYCAEVPWLQNDTIRANIMSSGGAVQLERWYNTVLRACALCSDIAALPQGDATVVGDRGELLSLSMRCRIAMARAVYSRSHVYLFDSVLSPLEPAIQEHVIREVFHRLLRKRTVILASNVGLRSLRPHRIFSLAEGGLLREDTELYKAVSSLDARSDDGDEDEEREEDKEEGEGNGADGSSRSTASNRSSDASQGTAAPPLPPLYAEEFAEPQEVSEVDVSKNFSNDPVAAATAMLFDADEGFRPRDPLFSDLGDRNDSFGNSGSNSGVLRPRRTVHFGPRTPTRPDSLLQMPGTPSQPSPRAVTLLLPVAPFPETGARLDASVTAATGSGRSSTLQQSAPIPSQNGRESSTHGNEAHSDTCSETTATTSETGSCSTGQYIRNHYAQQLEREKLLRHRHRLSFFIFLRFMGGQAMWLLFTTVVQQFVHIGIDIWAAIWLAVMTNTKMTAATVAGSSSGGGNTTSVYAKVRHQLYTWTAVTDAVFLAIVSALTVLTMVLTLLRTRAVYVSVYGTMHFIYNQIVRRILHAPASYFDSRIIALLTRVLESDAEVAEYHVPGTAEVLLSCTVQVVFIAAWNSVANPIFLLLLPITISLFYHISQRHAVVLREVRKLEAGSVSGMADILREVYQGASTVRCMALQDRLREEYCRALDTVNTASMVAYLADRWVELRLHVLTALAVCSAAMLGVVFTFAYSRPSFTAVAVIVALRVEPVLRTVCQSLGKFAVTEWVSVQRLMSLWSVPQEPLTLEGDADMYSYGHVRRRASGLYVELEGGQDAPLLDFVGTPFSSPKTLAAMGLQEQQQNGQKGSKSTRGDRQPDAGRGEGDGAQASATPVAPQSSLSVFAAASAASSSSSLAASGDRGAARHPAGEGATMTLPLLELRNVSARYRTTLPYVLRHVNLAVYPRERLGVVGHAGQGKGSLFNVLMRLVDVIEGGGVFIDGENAARVPYPALRGWFGLIPQDPLLVHGSWRSNLLMGYHPEYRVFVESANGKGGRPSVPIAALDRHKRPRQHPQQQREKESGGADTHTTTTTTTATAPTSLASHLAGGQQSETTPSVGATDGHDGHRPTHHSSHNLVSADDSAVSVQMSDSYGSTDSARAFVDGDGQSRGVRYMDSVEEYGPSRDVGGDLGEKHSSGIAATLARTARRVRDTFSPFHRRRNRSGTSGDGRLERTLSGDAGPARGNSGSGGGGRSGRRPRRRSSRQPSTNSGAVSGHPAEGPRAPMEDAALWNALRVVGLDVAVEFDGGLDATLTGGDVMEMDLTESQCRLLCLARAVLNRPPIVLLEDAVLSGVGAQTDRVVQRVLAKELRDSTVIIIAHRMSTVLNLCTRVVAMDGGTLLPIADLRSAVPSEAATAQVEEGTGLPASGTASLTGLSTPPLTASIHPDVLKQLSYYVE
ncbi:multidrug resistance protein [Leptomonas pyrrhocoris]|uniref:Multidrug resistance protein n=1 Tax=Leptomonas pyrrhocoris TaxID=157538 RepID=A0A0N0DUQ5_LEPPY|nr:multidrug resistance protein [Leptomonas pyrrhocoris]KPA79222.1 multidrug resistance protein [Leptomonas pyrrhocoris]|eukprot:XP_015657661.1 multidrug resistance protein [Leptomonas pyrrhocoris]